MCGRKTASDWTGVSCWADKVLTNAQRRSTASRISSWCPTRVTASSSRSWCEIFRSCSPSIFSLSKLETYCWRLSSSPDRQTESENEGDRTQRNSFREWAWIRMCFDTTSVCANIETLSQYKTFALVWRVPLLSVSHVQVPVSWSEIRSLWYRNKGIKQDHTVLWFMWVNSMCVRKCSHAGVTSTNTQSAHELCLTDGTACCWKTRLLAA